MAYTDDPEETETSGDGREAEYSGLEYTDYKKMWEEYATIYADARRASQRDRRFYDGDIKGTGEGHWTFDELYGKGGLSDRNQPPSVFNVVQRKVDATIGVELRTRSEPRALPRTPKDQQAAEVATDALRFIKDKTRWESKKTQSAGSLLIEGVSAVQIGGAPDDVPIADLGDDFFFDPRSRKHDFSDARYLGIAKWLDADTAKVTYAADPDDPEVPPPPPSDDPSYQDWLQYTQQLHAQYTADMADAAERRQAISGTVDGGLATAEYDDRPLNNFGDRTRKRVFVVDLWHNDPKHGWFRCVFTGTGKLFTEQASMIDPEDGRKVPPEQKRKTHDIVAQSAYVSADLWRYGMVRNMIPVQMEINKRRSKALHLLTTNQVIGTAQVFEMNGGVENLRAEVARPDAAIKTSDKDGVRIEKNMDLVQGQKEMHDDAVQFMEQYGPNPQLQGYRDGADSGRAILALQQAGLGQMAPIFERLADWELRCYRTMWTRVKQFWTAPMYVRVTDDIGSAKFAAVNGAPVYDKNNKPVFKGQGAQGGQAPDGIDLSAMPMVGPGAPPQSAQNPMLGHNGGPPMEPEPETGPHLSELDMDIVIDRAPEAASLQAEQFESLMKLAQSGVHIPPEALIEASAMPHKQAILDKMKSAEEEAAQKGPPPQIQAEMAKAKAEVEKLEAEIVEIKSVADLNTIKIAQIVAQIMALVPETNTPDSAAMITSLEHEAMPDGPAPMSAPGGMVPPPQTPTPPLSVPGHMPPPANGPTGLPPMLGGGPPPLTGDSAPPGALGNRPPL